MGLHLRIFTFLALISISTFVKADGLKGEIKGKIRDSETHHNIEYCSVALFDQTDSTLVTGTISDVEGFFSIPDLPYGRYFLKFTFIGYQEEIIANISISSEQTLVDVGDVQLDVLTENLDEVVITAEKTAIEYHIDKDVLNVAQLSNNAGGMIADVLNNHPSIQKSLDGSVKLRGSTNFIVLVDGKPTADESTDILNQIPSGTIEKVEIITNPSAKYDANHASGIVNIITKKSALNGFSGVINSAVSTAERYNADISLNYRTEKINLSAHSELYHSPVFQDRTSFEKRVVNGQEGFMNFHSDNILLWEGKNINVGIDYYASTRNTASFFVNRSSTVFGWSPQKTITEGTALETNYYLLDDFMRNHRDAWHYNFTDIHRFDANGHELSFDANMIVADMFRKNNQYLNHSNDTWEKLHLAEEYHLKRNQHIRRQQYKIDYSLPFNANNKLESGVLVKLDNRTIENDISSQIYSDTDEMLNNDEYETYNNLYAAYVSTGQRILKSDLQVGLRIEYINRNTTLANGDFNNTFEQLDFFPSLNLSRQFVNQHKIRFSYSRSIWRPTDLQLNPTVYFRDISGEFCGNAELEPSYTNALELNYNIPFGENSISATAFYKHMKNNIMTVRHFTQDSVYQNKPENLQGIQQDIGLELSGSFKLAKWIDLNPSGNFYNGYIKGSVTNQDINNRANVWSVRIITNLKPFADTRVQINTYYNSPTIGAQDYMKEIYGLSLSVKQNAFKDKLSISISGNDILKTEKRKFVVEGDSFKQQITDVFPKHPAYSLNLTFKFNNFKSKQREDVEQGIGFF